MRTLALQRESDSARRAVRVATPSSSAILAQRRSTLGPGGSAAAPAIVDAGRPLDAGTRSAMEAGFGRDLSNIRVHDDARAHDNARSLGSRAYAAGDHLVFGEGAYRPETSPGRALIAHEVAHSVQQGGIQMKADRGIPTATDAELESQADRAALDVTAGRTASGLRHIGRHAIFRSNGVPPAAPPAGASEAVGSATDLPGDVELIEETPKGHGATTMIVSLPLLTLPKPKGKGPWVQKAYTAMASENRLIFSPIFEGKAIKAYMEKPGDSYKDFWLNNYGFKSLKELGKAIRDAAAADPQVKAVADKPEVKKIVSGFANAGTLTAAGCDIDHIVEKQIGGTSVPGNLQLLVSDKNQESGRKTYAAMVDETKRILEPNRKFVRQLQIRFKDATVPEDVEDGSYEVEMLLRAGKVKGSEEVMKKGEGTPIQMVAGGASEVIRARATGATPIDASVRRLIPGMKLVEYKRGAGSSPTKGTDTVEAELASKPMLKGDKNITLTATIAPPPPTADPSAGASAAEKAVASEVRKLELDKVKNKDIPFYYPYLSKGKLTKLAVDESNNFTGEGVITPSVRFLGDLKVTFGPDTLVLVQDIDTAAINSSAFMKPVASIFRFTSGSVSIDLVKFKPKGTLDLEVGPKGKPVVLGKITATEEGGSFVATGTLEPGGSIPGIKDAKGQVSYRGDTGWSGELAATSASIPKSTTTVKLGFKEEKGAFRPYGEGNISTTVRNANLNLTVGWNGASVSYRGAVTVEKPLPLVDRVELKGTYEKETLEMIGHADIKWRGIDSKMTVTYRRKDGDDEGKFSGKADVEVKSDKATGKILLTYADDGRFSGRGSIAYQLTKDIRPTLGIELTPAGRLKVLGEVALADIPLTKMWPAPAGGKLTFIKGAGVKFSIPTPVPAVTAFGQIKVSAGLGYGVGPVMLKGVVFTGELYPLEDDPKIKANLKGKLVVPAYGEIYGTFGAYIGVEVALGAVGAKGGIEVTPTLRLQAEAVLGVDAAYESYAFTFSAEAYVKGQLIAKLKVDLMAELSAAWGIWSHTWTYNVAAIEKKLGPELTLTLGKIAYGKGGEITLPSLSQVSLEPKDLDPLDLVKDLLREGKATDK